ncbi:CTP4 [Auxenochlorella protothecoides x Auxenochlorella symbiontica]
MQTPFVILSHLSSTWQRPSGRRPSLQSCRPCAAASTATVSVTPPISEPAPHTVVLDVSGMKCGGCVSAVKRTLLRQPGISSASVNLVLEGAVIEARDDEATARAVRALASAGFPSIIRPREAHDLRGRGAEKEAAREEELLQSTWNAAISWGLASACLLHHAGHALHALGLTMHAHSGVWGWLGHPYVGAGIGAAALAGPGRTLIVNGARALSRGHPDMNSLIALGVATAFGTGLASAFVPGIPLDASLLEEPVMLLAFVLLGRTLEARARKKASVDLSALSSLIPEQSRLVIDDGEGSGASRQVPTDILRRGDVILVLPGERVPVDGEVVDGRASLDESLVTGESRLVPAAPGARVKGGVVCHEGVLRVRASASAALSTVSGIARMVEDAQAREAPVQRLADAVAGRFCFGIMAVSAATLAFWAGPGAALFPGAAEAAGLGAAGATAPYVLAARLAVDVLVVACPCALGLATPTAVLVGSSAAARRGVLIGGGDVLERLAAVDTVVLDKTGTLTQGRPRLVARRGAGEDATLALAAALESVTRHPLADAFIDAARARGLAIPSASEVTTVAGEGVWGVVDGAVTAVGRQAWVLGICAAQRGDGGDPAMEASTARLTPDAPAGPSARDASTDSTARNASTDPPALESSTTGSSTVWVARAGRGLVGSLAVEDGLRPGAARTVAALRRRGLRVVLLTGDGEGPARAAARAAGIDEVHWDARPGDKAGVVRGLRAAGAVVAMVGDGVNDAPALATADVGMAMAGGTDAAAGAAGVVLVGEGLDQVCSALDAGRAALRTIRQNLGWAVGYNAVGVPLAAGAALPSLGLAISPSLAAGFMAFSSIAVVGNSLRLRDRIAGRPAT